MLERVEREHGGNVEITWHAYELRPEPGPTLNPRGQYLTDIWRQAVYPMAADRGMKLRLPPVQPRSRSALEAAEYARAQGKFAEMNDALFRAFFERGEDLGDLECLVKIGASVELEQPALRDALERGTYRDRVVKDEEMAEELGISGVPAMLIRRDDEALEDSVIMSGAQPYAAVLAEIDRVRRNNDDREKV